MREEELRGVLLNILRTGLLRIRVLSWAGRAEDCAVEADHLHNLPHIARDLKIELVESYYTIGRSEFVKRAKDLKGFEEDWKRLGEILAEIGSSGPNKRS